MNECVMYVGMYYVNMILEQQIMYVCVYVCMYVRITIGISAI